jgi:CubicO group peptidase (beta-lactamase class C family)
MAPTIVAAALLLTAAFLSQCAPAAPTSPPTPSPSPTPTLTPTPLPTLTSTPMPTQTPTPAPTPTPTPTPTPWPLEGSTPEQQGMDSERLLGILDYLEQHRVDFNGMLIVRKGYTVLEVYASPSGSDRRHSNRSCGKGFTSALVGIAIDEGYINGVDQRVLDFFPEYAAADIDPRKETMTIEHLLTMSSGLAWPESAASYSSSSNIMNQMMRSSNWVRFVLERPMVAEPGTRFNYSSGDSHLLSAVLHEATGMSALSYARTRLFEPLGISRVYWPADPQGRSFGAGGIHLTARDMVRFGQLYLQGGIWDGQQIIPPDWVEASIARQIQATGAAPYYGYQWWVRSSGTYAAHGYEGRRIFVLPDLEMVVVFTGDLAGSAPSWLLSTYIVPAARSNKPLPKNPSGAAALETRVREFEQSGP